MRAPPGKCGGGNGGKGGPKTKVIDATEGPAVIFRSNSPEKIVWAPTKKAPAWIDVMGGDKGIFGKVYLAFTSAGFAYGEERPSP